MTVLWCFLVGMATFFAGMAVMWELGPKRCPHLRVRCVHGDEINAVDGKRRLCDECGWALDGPLPEPCTVTGESHLSSRAGGG